MYKIYIYNYVDFCISVLCLMDEIHPTRPEMLIKWWRIKGYVHHFKGFAEDMPPKTVFAKQIHARWQFPLRFWGRVVVHEEFCPDMCLTMPLHTSTPCFEASTKEAVCTLPEPNILGACPNSWHPTKSRGILRARRVSSCF